MKYNSSMIQKIIPSQDIDSTLTAWLAGLIDGEGSVSLYLNKRRNKYSLIGIVVINTDLKILNKVIKIYKQMGIASKINLHNPSKNHDRTSYKSIKPCYTITIRRRDDIEKIIPRLLPYLAGDKRDKSIRLLEYLKNHPRQEKESFYCYQCSKKIHTRAKKYCSLKCWHEYSVGIKNPNWRHGKFISGVTTKRQAPVLG